MKTSTVHPELQTVLRPHKLACYSGRSTAWVQGKLACPKDQCSTGGLMLIQLSQCGFGGESIRPVWLPPQGLAGTFVGIVDLPSKGDGLSTSLPYHLTSIAYGYGNTGVMASL